MSPLSQQLPPGDSINVTTEGQREQELRDRKTVNPNSREKNWATR